MTIATSVLNHLQRNAIHYRIVSHPHSGCSSESARYAHVSGDHVAKGVVLRDAAGYLLAVLPAEHMLDVDKLNERLGRVLEFARESEIRKLFPDCELGAVPALGPVYGIETVVDESLTGFPDLYFEGGDHESLIGVTEGDFRALLRGARFAKFSHHKH